MAFEKETAVRKLREMEAKQAALAHAEELLTCEIGRASCRERV